MPPVGISAPAQCCALPLQVRMNMLNNWLPGERLDIWVSRHAGRPPAMFYGFEQDDAAVLPEEVQAPFSVRCRWCCWAAPRKP